MNYETICDPIPGAEIDGYTFRRDQNGTIIARCISRAKRPSY